MRTYTAVCEARPSTAWRRYLSPLGGRSLSLYVRALLGLPDFPLLFALCDLCPRSPAETEDLGHISVTGFLYDPPSNRCNKYDPVAEACQHCSQQTSKRGIPGNLNKNNPGHVSPHVPMFQQHQYSVRTCSWLCDSICAACRRCADLPEAVCSPNRTQDENVRFFPARRDLVSAHNMIWSKPSTTFMVPGQAIAALPLCCMLLLCGVRGDARLAAPAPLFDYVSESLASAPALAAEGGVEALLTAQVRHACDMRAALCTCHVYPLFLQSGTSRCVGR